MVNVLRVRELLSAVAARSDWHFAIGVRIRFANPTLLYQTYPEAWVNTYAEQALIFVDPTVRWGMEHPGICRWSELSDQDEAGVMAKAADFGLRYGIVVSVGEASARTLGFFCRPERELTDEEASFALETVQVLHDETSGIGQLSETQLAELRNLGAGLRH
ncbi:autoinducer binding domain-containing protein [Cereibacter sphaeroides]|uniref:autoinducer binding domain-containing protein n=1 Tax=Rhodobacterales TaxID=204455 RepID=UPI000BBF083F|nr:MULTISPECIES: autoinducer binding domain-containing protein [Paracoccaceae]MCE6953052.1 autoinducer binding domain-containing protein [Cereibacter sphaeroides]MCE6961849.1 autoinducer binding domain-containing protein [Cereibacter sphaeroides]MCE6970624.1 autoinducer binding domain-containing protein [Cereibacter sphaeroides]MCE6975780.1 autoinducer binding domain-containing protein [Cereibacter sphaeroides]